MVCKRCPMKGVRGKEFKRVPKRYEEAHKRFHKNGSTAGRKRPLVRAENLRLNRV